MRKLLSGLHHRIERFQVGVNIADDEITQSGPQPLDDLIHELLHGPASGINP
jgi:hypothetical protein